MVRRAKLIWMLGALVLGVTLSLAVVLMLFLGESGTVKTRSITILSDSAEQQYSGEALVADGYRLVDGELRDGHKLVVKTTGTQTKIGESSNYFTASVVDSKGNDVSSQYAIECVPGKLKVVQIPITIMTTGAVKLYDGEPLYSPQLFTVEPPEIEKQFRIEASFTEGLSVTSPNESKKDTAKVKIYNKVGNDVTTFFDIEYDYGELKIELLLIPPVSLPEDGAGLDLSGNIAENPEKDDESDEEIYYTLTSSSDDYVYLKILSYADCIDNQWTEALPYQSLLTGRYSAMYIPSYLLNQIADPTVLQITSHKEIAAMPYHITTYENDVLIQKNDISASAGAEYRVVYYPYEDTEGYLLPENVAAYEEKYAEYVRENYLWVEEDTLQYMLGVIAAEGFSAEDPYIIEEVAAFISEAIDYNKDYDPALDLEDNMIIAVLERYREGLCRHYASCATVLFRALGIPARYTVGFAAETFAGASVSVKGESFHAWVEVYVDGFGWRAVEVTQGFGDGMTDKTEITLKPAPVEVKYDPESPQTITPIDELDEESIAALTELGCTYEVVIDGELSGLGKAESRIKKIKIFRDGVDVTKEFRIKKQKGVLRLYYAEIGFISDGKSVEYGKTVVGEKEDVRELDIYESLMPGHRVEIVSDNVSNSTFNVAAQNTYSVLVFDEEGNEITECYKIRYEYGDLTVVAAKISVGVNDKKIVLEDLPEDPTEKIIEFVIPDDFTIEGLVGDDYVESIDVDYRIDGYGRTALSIVGIKIVNKTVDEAGEEIINDVTANYIAEYHDGTLTITFF